MASATAESRAAEARPNIVYIMSDDHGYQAISAYGSKLTSTPNIDRIANEGVRFDRCYVTNSLCGPSRACLLTGTYSHTNGMYDHYTSTFNDSLPTFPKLLQAAGYQTAFVGKWHLTSDPAGFDHWDMLPGQGKYYKPDFVTAEGRTANPGYATDIITEKSLDWLEQERDPDKPFLLIVHHKAPHRPWDRPVLRQATPADIVRRPSEHAVALHDRGRRIGRQVDARVDHADLRRHRRRRRVREELRARVHRLGCRPLRRERDLRARGGDECRRTDGDQPPSSPHLRPQPLTVTRTCLDSPVLNGKPASARTRARKTYFAFPTVRVNL
jgi:arylsulfatase A-like enzyme